MRVRECHENTCAVGSSTQNESLTGKCTGVPQQVMQLCKFIAAKIEQKNIIPENTPHSIAGGIIYFVSQICNLNISKATINSISRISEVTINKCCKKLELHKNELVPAVILKKYA